MRELFTGLPQDNRKDKRHKSPELRMDVAFLVPEISGTC
jgi:hypothetical protein